MPYSTAVNKLCPVLGFFPRFISVRSVERLTANAKKCPTEMRVHSSVSFPVFMSTLFSPYADLLEVCPHDSFSHIKSCLIFQDWYLAPNLAVISFPYQPWFVFPWFWETTFQTQVLDTFSKGSASDGFYWHAKRMFSSILCLLLFVDSHAQHIRDLGLVVPSSLLATLFISFFGTYLFFFKLSLVVHMLIIILRPSFVKWR